MYTRFKQREATFYIDGGIVIQAKLGAKKNPHGGGDNKD